MAPKRKNTAAWDVYEEASVKDRRRANYDTPQHVNQPTTILPEDDEEIDESEAFDSEDERKYGGFFGGKTAKVNIMDERESESESEDEDESEDESDEDGSQGESEEESEDGQQESGQVESGLQESSSSDEDSDSKAMDLTSLLSFEKNKRPKHTNIPSLEPTTLSLTDLLPQTNSFSALKSQVASLTSTQALPTPAPHRLKQRLDRVAAYAEASTSITKYQQRVKVLYYFFISLKANREADSITLATTEPQRTSTTLSSITSTHRPQTDMEHSIHSLLLASSLTTETLQKAESLQLNQLSHEDLAQKRTELLKQRNLLFYSELKQKKISKIKSKTYRKLNRKSEKEIDLETLKTLDPAAAEQRMLQMETDRAQERMSLKHKNTGKWAKQMLTRKDGNDETHQAIMNQLQKHEDLKRKIIGASESDSDLSLGEARQALQAIQQEEPQSTPTTGLMAMKFMQRGIKEKQEATARQAAEALNHLASSDSDSDDEVAVPQKTYSDDEELTNAYLAKFKAESSSGAHYTDTALVMDKLDKHTTRQDNKPNKVVVSESESSDSDANPWLTETTAPLQRAKSHQRTTVLVQQPATLIQAPTSLPTPPKPSQAQPQSDSEQEDEATDAALGTPHTLTKQQLLTLAFGTDDQPEGFLSSSEDEQTPTLIGWGSWSNQAKTKKPAKPKPVKVLKRVVIDGKMQKSLKPYMVSAVPHGYDSKAQFERTMRMGLGKEWNTATVHQKRIKPRIVTRPGQVILPMK